MIIKIIDFYFKTDLEMEAVDSFIRNSIEEYVQENGEIDLEHWIENIQESEKFEEIMQEDSDLSYSEEDIDNMIDSIQEDEEIVLGNEDEDDDEIDMNDEEDEDE